MVIEIFQSNFENYDLLIYPLIYQQVNLLIYLLIYY